MRRAAVEFCRGEAVTSVPLLPPELWAHILRQGRLERAQLEDWVAWANATLMKLVVTQALLLKKVFGAKMGQCNGFPMKEVLGCEAVGTNIFESSPIDWEIHMDDGEYYEEGSNNMKLFGGSAKKQKWMKHNRTHRRRRHKK